MVGFQDETWWSRLAQPALHGWSEPKEPLRLVEQGLDKGDLDPRALACYGLLRADTDRLWLRFVAGQPVSGVTTQFLGWVSERLAHEGKKALFLVWDNAPWHISCEVKAWLRAHNRRVKATGEGVRLISCPLPVKSPWLNNIEPHWQHGKRSVVEPSRVLSAAELEQRVCAYYGCPPEPHLTIPDKLP